MNKKEEGNWLGGLMFFVFILLMAAIIGFLSNPALTPILSGSWIMFLYYTGVKNNGWSTPSEGKAIFTVLFWAGCGLNLMGASMIIFQTESSLFLSLIGSLVGLLVSLKSLEKEGVGEDPS